MSSIFTENVVPALGNCLSSFMLCSPLPAVLRVRVAGTLGDVNMLPYPLTIVNAVGWLSYGLSSGNPYLFPSNILGLLAGFFFTFSAYEYASRRVKDVTLAIVVLAAAHFITLGLIDCYALGSSAADHMWGINAIVILMIYYIMPLSSMLTVIRTRSAASLYPPLAAAAVANGTLWTVYGFAISDVNIWLPNLFGAVIGVLELLLRLRYGCGTAAGSDMPGTLAEQLHVAASGPAKKGQERPASILMPLAAASGHSFDSHAMHKHMDGNVVISIPAASSTANEASLMGSITHGMSHEFPHHGPLPNAEAAAPWQQSPLPLPLPQRLA